MMNQFQHHVITTFWTKQRVFSEAFEEKLSERLWPKNSVGINLGTGKAKAGLAGESNSAYFSTVAASALNKAHLVRVAAEVTAELLYGTTLRLMPVLLCWLLYMLLPQKVRHGTEKKHKELFEKAKDAVNSSQDVELGPVQVCQVCGYTLEGNAPDTCPLCGVSKEKFTAFE